MAITLAQVDTFHEDRGNTAWADLDDRAAALLNAFDYVEAVYAPLVAEADQEPRYLIGVAQLALRLAQNPQTGVAAPVIKKEKIDGGMGGVETEFFEPTSSDPFPGVTALLAPLKAGQVVPSVSFGKLVR